MQQRLVAITPPTGPVHPGTLATWREAGASPDNLLIVLRSPGCEPEELMTGRLREFAEQARDLGYLIVLSVAPPGLPIACKEVARHGLAGVQLKRDPSADKIVDARKRLVDSCVRRPIVGCSHHGQPQTGHDGWRVADYICAAPVFTPTTPQAGVQKTAAGLEMLRGWVATGARVFALGGVTGTTAPACMSAGAWGLAGIGAFFGESSRVSQNVRHLLSALH